jgi:IMP dehydrogenase
MTDVTGVEMAIALGKLGGLGVLPRFMPIDEQAQMANKVKKENVPLAAAVGVREDSLDRAKALVDAGVVVLFLDVAHGHMQMSLDMTNKLKNEFKDRVDIVSGNVATYEGAKALFEAGADSVKVGVGPGAICTTRIETGSGVPQITAVMESVRAAKEFKKTVICDGGIKNAGDIVKGLAAGASAIMAGSKFAGTDEAPGKIVHIGGKKYKEYKASTSIKEKKNHIKKNGDALSPNYIKQIEGIESIVFYKGPLKEVVYRMVAGIKSGFSYSGAKNIEELWQKAKFVRISAMGLLESGPHDVIVDNNE